MTIFDYSVLFILIVSVIISTMRGIVKEILSLAAWIFAFIIANAYAAKIAPYFPLNEQSYRLIVAYISLFIGVHLLMWLISKLIEGLLEASGLKLVDRGLGSLFGVARGCVIIMALMLVCGMTRLPQQPFWRQALLRPVIESAAMTIKPYLPGAFARYVRF